MHRFEFAGLEAAPLVVVECEVAQLGEGNLVQWELAVGGLHALRDKCEQFNLLGDFALVGKELDLTKIHSRGELNDDFLRKLAELGTLPPLRIDRRVE